MKRLVDKKLLKLIRTLPCLVCATTRANQVYQTEPDHITTRGAGGDDTVENVWPLCGGLSGHHAERHRIGLYSMICKYPVLRNWLELAERFDVLDRMERVF